MTKHKLPQHQGRLSFEQIAAGMNAASSNAQRLFIDAKAMFSAGRLPTATALAILSIEESGKIAILRELVLAESDAECKEIWRAYRSHTKKNVTWMLSQLFAGGARTLEAMRPLFDSASDHPHVLEQLKQLSLYTDCFTSGKWSHPDEVDLEKITPHLLKVAEIHAGSRPVTPIELELWHKFMLPVKGADLETSKQALRCWYDELKARGIDRSAKLIDSFLGSGLPPMLSPAGSMEDPPVVPEPS